MKKNNLPILIAYALIIACIWSDPVITMKAVDKDLKKLINTSLPADSLSHVMIRLGPEPDSNQDTGVGTAR